jgi:hypothetical protein
VKEQTKIHLSKEARLAAKGKKYTNKKFRTLHVEINRSELTARSPFLSVFY